MTVRLPHGGTEALGYDARVLAPGVVAVRPRIADVDLPEVQTLRTLPDADAIRATVGDATRPVVLGAGFTGLEHGVTTHVGVAAEAVTATPAADHAVAVAVAVAVSLTDGTSLPADIVVLSVGVRPDSTLAADAGLELTPAGAIVVDTALRARLAEVREAAGDRPVRVHCASGFRSYLAHRGLVAAGLDAASLSGGLLTLRAARPDLVLEGD